MAQEIYHKSEWGNPTETWGNVYLNADLTNELYKRASEYENSWVTDQLLNGVGIKPSIILTPTAYEDGVLNSVKPAKTFGNDLSGGVGNYDNLYGSTTVTDGSANILSTGSLSGLGWSNILTVGRKYKFSYNVIDSTLGQIKITGGSSDINLDSTVGSHFVEFTSAYVYFNILRVASCDITINNISLQLITEAVFDFTRGSSATRVNEQGLVEDVQILSGELVQNGDFEQIGTEEISNGDFEQIGDELVPSIATIVNLGGGSITQISGNSYSSTSDGTSGSTVRPKIDFATTSGKIYKLVITPIGTVTGTVNFDFYDGSTYLFQNYDFTTTKEVYFKDNGNVFGAFDGTQTYSISNFTVSVKEVGQDWSFGTGWSMGDGKGVATNTSSYIKQNSVVTNNKIFKVTFDAIVTSGRFRLVTTADAGTYTSYITSDGSYTFYMKPTVSINGGFEFVGDGFTGSIDNVSVKEVGQNWTFDNSGGSFGWQIYDGKAICDGNASTPYRNLVSSTSLTSGKKYRLNLDILQSADNITVYVGGGAVSETLPTGTNLNYTLEFTATSSGALTFYAGTDDLQELDNISVIEVTDDTDLPRINYTNFSYEDVLGDELVTNGSFDTDSDWTKGTGWSIADGRASYDGLNGTQQIFSNTGYTPVVGKTYKITFDVLSQGDGNNTASFGGVVFSNTNLSVNSYEFYVTAVSTGRFGIFGRNGGVFSIDNVSVKELTEDVVVPYSGEGSLLLEPQSTNKVTYSEDFSQWSLGANATLTFVSDIEAPDGSLGVYRLQLPATNDTFIASNSFTGQNPLALSIYAKSVNTNNDFNLYNGSASSPIKTATDKWQRFDYIGNGNQFYIVNSGDTFITDIYIWGAQAEALSYATSYIPTNGSTVTRLADVCNNSGNSDLINSTEGVLYVEALLKDTGTFKTAVRITATDTSTTDGLWIYFRNDNKIQGVLRVGSTDQVGILSTVQTTDEYYKVAFKYKQNDFALWVNGTEVGTDTNGNVFSADTLTKLGFVLNNTINPFIGNVKCVAVFKEALSDTELEKLTTI